jgi:hypothetical protein
MSRFDKDLKKMDRSFDVEYWRRMGPEAIQAAAWELFQLKVRQEGGDPDALRLDRTVGSFQRRRPKPSR